MSSTTYNSTFCWPKAISKSRLSRGEQRDVPGIHRPIDVLACDDLILLKLLAGRVIDRADAAMLLRENRDTLDFEHLRFWVARLDLTMEFTEIWGEAFPGEDRPAANS